MRLPSRVRIVEVGPRDGLQNERASIATADKIAFVNALTTNLEALALWWLLRRRIGSINDKSVLMGAGKALIAALGMGVVLWLVESALSAQGALVTLIAGGLVGGVIFFGLSLLLRLEEATAIPTMLLRRFKR